MALLCNASLKNGRTQTPLEIASMGIPGAANELNQLVPSVDSRGTQGTLPDIVRCALARQAPKRGRAGRSAVRAATATDTSVHFYRALHQKTHGGVGPDGLLVLALHSAGDAISEEAVAAAAAPHTHLR